MARVVVRFFAAARAAAGVSEQTVTAASVAECLDRVRELHGIALTQILPACSFLVDGQAVKDRHEQLADSATLDVLPPFAGG
jgi:molybdopterin synthase sulfur carrier subunit